jgi:hypothetical protein
MKELDITYSGAVEDGIMSLECPIGKKSAYGNSIMVGSCKCIECEYYIKGNRFKLFCKAG